MRKQTWAPAIAALLALLLSGCADRSVYVGGPCEYSDIHGKAVITDVGGVDADEANCGNDPRAVLFDFTPDNPRARYQFPNWADKGQRLTVAGGKNPPAAWLRSQGLKPGAVFPCVRREIRKGTCTPVIYHFPDIDQNAAAGACK